MDIECDSSDWLIVGDELDPNGPFVLGIKIDTVRYDIFLHKEGLE